MKTAISKKYGQPEEDTNWKDKSSKDDREGWGMAIMQGQLEKSALWETERTEIILQLKGENDKANFVVKYESKDPDLKRMVTKHTEKPQQSSKKPSASPKKAVCSCSGNIYNCKDFKTHAEAQACFDYCGPRDVHKLDRDKDGVACESLP